MWYDLPLNASLNSLELWRTYKATKHHEKNISFVLRNLRSLCLNAIVKALMRRRYRSVGATRRVRTSKAFSRCVARHGPHNTSLVCIALFKRPLWKKLLSISHWSRRFLSWIKSLKNRQFLSLQLIIIQSHAWHTLQTTSSAAFDIFRQRLRSVSRLARSRLQPTVQVSDFNKLIEANKFPQPSYNIQYLPFGQFR